MQALPEEIYAVQSVRAMDRRAIDEHGIAGYTLMTRAGEAAVREGLRAFPGTRRWVVFCGAGNNGGDGYVVARLAREAGLGAVVVAVADPAQLSGDAARARDDYLAQGGEICPWPRLPDPPADLLVDALLGSGLERPVEGPIADAVRAINAGAAPVLSLDLPTGIHGDTGTVLGVAVAADLTVTFVGLKAGLFQADGRVAAGRIAFAGLDVPAACREAETPVLLRIAAASICANLPPRRRDAHKGDFGHVVIVGGGPGMPGAVRLAGEAALRAGAGKVTVATTPLHAPQVGAACPELMTRAVDSSAALAQLLETADVVAFGPGLGTGDWARAMFDAASASSVPAVWDADALNLLAASGVQAPYAAPRIITPHPGEAGRLLQRSAREIQADRLNAVRALCELYGGIAVLKGAGTLVAETGRVPAVCTAGNPGMATAGMGDVLAGVIAGLLAQGIPAFAAASTGVEVHARAGDLAARTGERGLLARDLIAALRSVVNPALPQP